MWDTELVMLNVVSYLGLMTSICGFFAGITSSSAMATTISIRISFSSQSCKRIQVI